VDSHNTRTIWRLTAFLVVVILIGTIGFNVSAHMTLGDAFYETLIILLDRYDHLSLADPVSRTLVILLTVTSLGFIAYLLKWLAEYMMGLGLQPGFSLT
jgi:hypothetical protein